MKFIIVDDEKLLAKTIAEVLGELGFDVKIAFDGAQALEMIQFEEFDLIISDIDMPYINGIELGQILRSLNIMTKIIYMSGAAEAYKNKYKEELAAIIPLKVIDKPHLFTELISLVRGASLIKSEYGVI